MSAVAGRFVTRAGERWYEIANVDHMAPFFVSLVSDDDLWLFVSSNGGLTAGRVSPDIALFPYVTVDKIYDSTEHTGSKTLVRCHKGGRTHLWEPFNRHHDGRFATTRNLYKNLLGNKILFEEVNADLGLAFRYMWAFSAEYGFVRSAELENTAGEALRVELVDGLQNLLPAGTPRFAQTNTSNLVDAYKWSELDEQTGLAMLTLYSGITDRAEPCESLRATTAFCLGLDERTVLLSSAQLDAFAGGEPLHGETLVRGVRGAYLVNAALTLEPRSSRRWQIVAEVDQSQGDCVALAQRLADPATLAADLSRSIEAGTDTLARIMGAADGYQRTAEENVSAHHYANVLFNVLRGGIVDDQNRVGADDLRRHVAAFNRPVYKRHRALLEGLPERIDAQALLDAVQRERDPQLERLTLEYLPVTFGRRHGDPSRPWNLFAIKLRDEHGKPLLSYQGNWRDIFQNWEALLFSFPGFIDNVIAKFVNASTLDGYNPYRITSDGIDWEVEDPDDPWSYIGYWGDHQIIYLLKLLELSQQFHPQRLGRLLHRPLFSYANVPYRIKPFEDLLADARNTVVYDEDLARRIEQRVAEVGADGKLVHDTNGRVVQVTLLEKLLVPLMAKLGNLVLDGGVWLNTQRPEWNDANNALVGQGLSMVTLCYMRRYATFLQGLLEGGDEPVQLSAEVGLWLSDTTAALAGAGDALGHGPVDARRRFEVLETLGRAAGRHRDAVYRREGVSGRSEVGADDVRALLARALDAIDHSIHTNRREDGLYHAYNTIDLAPGTARVEHLYAMLEGQVAVLSAGVLDAAQSIEVIEALFASDVYRPDQASFMLYPDRALPRFLEKNCVPDDAVAAVPLLAAMHEGGDGRIVERDAAGTWRFHPDFRNVSDLDAALDALGADYGDQAEAAREPLRALFESVFDHKSFTGRSGGMFGFEGLGSIYWHMVAKLLLAVQERFFDARAAGAKPRAITRLGELYYRVREGIGFNKTPEEYGAFPMDPYSHTPGHAGAQQPGMTGQVKEEILTRFGELGVRVSEGAVKFEPALLREREFADEPEPLRYPDVDGHWQTLALPPRSLAFTWCQVPIVYSLASGAEPALTVTFRDGRRESFPAPELAADIAAGIYGRGGDIRALHVSLGEDALFGP